MKITQAILLAAVLLSLALWSTSAPWAAEDMHAHGHADAQHTIAISDSWAASTPPGARVGAGYFTLTNIGAAADTLLGITSQRAPRVQLHEIVMDGDIARMRQVQDLTLAPGESLALVPGGHHLMFLDITSPFVADESVPVTLTFAEAGAVEILLPVRDRDVSQDHGHEHH